MEEKIREPYTYTMPEEFMADQSVPIQWRLLGVLRGFFFNNLPVYATNEWLMARLGCSERTIQRGIQELEDLKLIQCQRSGNRRIILPRHELRGTPSPIDTPPRHQLLHNSDILIQKEDTDSGEIAEDRISPSSVHLASELNILPSEEGDDDAEVTFEESEDCDGYRAPTWGKKPKKEPNQNWDPTLKAIEQIFKKRFLNRPKQYAALKKLHAAGVSTKEIQQTIERMIEKPFYKENGWDLNNVVTELERN